MTSVDLRNERNAQFMLFKYLCYLIDWSHLKTTDTFTEQYLPQTLVTSGELIKLLTLNGVEESKHWVESDIVSGKCNQTGTYKW